MQSMHRTRDRTPSLHFLPILHTTALGKTPSHPIASHHVTPSMHDIVIRSRTDEQDKHACNCDTCASFLTASHIACLSSEKIPCSLFICLIHIFPQRIETTPSFSPLRAWDGLGRSGAICWRYTPAQSKGGRGDTKLTRRTRID